MHSTFTVSHTLWSTTATWLTTARSATCYTTVEKERLDKIYQGDTASRGFSTGSYITREDVMFLIKAWTKMLDSKNYLGN